MDQEQSVTDGLKRFGIVRQQLPWVGGVLLCTNGLSHKSEGRSAETMSETGFWLKRPESKLKDHWQHFESRSIGLGHQEKSCMDSIVALKSHVKSNTDISYR